MSIGANVLSSKPVILLRDMYAAEYASRAIASANSQAPAILNALGACAGFAAQMAVWRELVWPKNRNPGDFLLFATTQSGDVFFFGEAINQFLFAGGSDRLSFLSLAAGTLSDASQLPDIGELLGHVSQSIGSDTLADRVFRHPSTYLSFRGPHWPRPGVRRRKFLKTVVQRNGRRSLAPPPMSSSTQIEDCWHPRLP
jgi:hypothetical protein